MSYKQGQEPHPSYMDGVKVKISERYKPPPKISLPMSYAQRLTLNDHIQNNIPKYDFSFEKNAKEFMKALKTTKLTTSNQRKERLEKIREVREKEKQDKIKDKEQNSDTNIQNEEAAFNINDSKHLNTDNFSTYPSSTGFLIPTQVSSTYTNILTPTLLTESNTQSYGCQSTDKSPFNISDFEADTSSPFDNMALKTINDMAELAIVLQNEDKNINKQTYTFTPVTTTATGPYTQQYTNYSGNQQQYHYPELPSTSTGVYVQPANCVYSASNGYYYDTNPSTYDSSSYLYNNTTIHNYNNSFDTTSPQNNVDNTNKENNTVIKTVPDIMKALETELNNTYINKINQQSTVSNNINSSYNHKRNKEQSNSEMKSDDLDDSYRNLPKNLQILSKNISSMGFPLDRVSRVCKLLGDDQKKVVEHLLAMSDLLDLGFAETQVSSALVQCDNDRDKALDKLIL